jgi:hypothetical protein
MQLTKETTSAVAAAPPGDTWHMPSEAVAARYATPHHQPPSTAAGHGGCRRKDWRQACLPPPADRLARSLSLFCFVLFYSVLYVCITVDCTAQTRFQAVDSEGCFGRALTTSENQYTVILYGEYHWRRPFILLARVRTALT